VCVYIYIYIYIYLFILLRVVLSLGETLTIFDSLERTLLQLKVWWKHRQFNGSLRSPRVRSIGCEPRLMKRMLQVRIPPSLV
jgi:hypothetical protein